MFILQAFQRTFDISALAAESAEIEIDLEWDGRTRHAYMSNKNAKRYIALLLADSIALDAHTLHLSSDPNNDAIRIFCAAGSSVDEFDWHEFNAAPLHALEFLIKCLKKISKPSSVGLGSESCFNARHKGDRMQIYWNHLISPERVVLYWSDLRPGPPVIKNCEPKNPPTYLDLG